MVALLGTAACSPTRPPLDELDAASRAFGAARDAGATQWSPAEYRAAGQHFDAAQAAENQQDYPEAAQFAAQSLADSELAIANARLGKARAEVERLKQQNASLDRDLATPATTGERP